MKLDIFSPEAQQCSGSLSSCFLLATVVELLECISLLSTQSLTALVCDKTDILILPLQHSAVQLKGIPWHKTFIFFFSFLHNEKKQKYISFSNLWAVVNMTDGWSRKLLRKLLSASDFLLAHRCNISMITRSPPCSVCMRVCQALSVVTVMLPAIVCWIVYLRILQYARSCCATV